MAGYTFNNKCSGVVNYDGYDEDCMKHISANIHINNEVINRQ